jgi:hypothetical protein
VCATPGHKKEAIRPKRKEGFFQKSSRRAFLSSKIQKLATNHSTANHQMLGCKKVDVLIYLVSRLPERRGILYALTREEGRCNQWLRVRRIWKNPTCFLLSGTEKGRGSLATLKAYDLGTLERIPGSLCWEDHMEIQGSTHKSNFELAFLPKPVFLLHTSSGLEKLPRLVSTKKLDTSWKQH